MIAVIQHHKNGGAVEAKAKYVALGKWHTAVTPSWDFASMNFRIKREPIVRWAVMNMATDCVISSLNTKDKALEDLFSLRKQFPNNNYILTKLVEETTD